MPLLSVVAIRLALANLLVGFTLGAMLLVNKALPDPPFAVPGGMVSHMACVLYGWALQLAIGVSFWILPRFLEGAPRGDERPAWLAIGFLNAGVLAAFFTGNGVVVHVFELVGALAYGRHIFPRIRGVIMPVREADRRS